MELSDGRRFSVKTQKELKSVKCKDIKYSSLFIDSPARYDAQEAVDAIRRESRSLWQNLETAVQNRDFDEVKRVMVLLEVFRTNHLGFN